LQKIKGVDTGSFSDKENEEKEKLREKFGGENQTDIEQASNEDQYENNIERLPGSWK